MYQTPAVTFKRLVFAFYYSKDNDIKMYNEIHFKMLEKYINIFDEVIFCITIDDINDYKSINEIQRRIVSFRNGPITFKIYENTNYRETNIFYNEIFLKMKDLYGLTFFAHSKGKGLLENIEEIVGFITASYFFSLENINEVNKYPFYGSFKMINNSPMSRKGNKYMWFYVGTFFWGDYQRIYKEKNGKFPKFSTRWFNEMLPGELYNAEECGSLFNNFIDATIKPSGPFDLIYRIYGENELYNEYCELYYKIINMFKQ